MGRSSVAGYYGLEMAFSLMGAFVVFMIFVSRWLLEIKWNEFSYGITTSLSIVIFISGLIYNRISVRRNGAISKAIEIRKEWDSKELRESRIYYSRVRSRCAKEGRSFPEYALSKLEELASGGSPSVGKADGEPNRFSDYEYHFFTLYSFFDRVAKLLQSRDVDRNELRSQMKGYLELYEVTFFRPLLGMEKDEYMRDILADICSALGKSR